MRRKRGAALPRTCGGSTKDTFSFVIYTDFMLRTVMKKDTYGFQE